jgi:predicted DNA binding CopG/RHH family protein
MREYYQHKKNAYKSPEKRKRNSIQVKYPDAEYEAICRRARSKGMTLGAYIRHCMRNIVAKIMRED